eukprot:9088448-Karenia_brevis.AAC.1
MADLLDDERDPQADETERDHIEELQEHMAKVSRQLMTKIGNVLTSFDDRVDEIGEEFKTK